MRMYLYSCENNVLEVLLKNKGLEERKMNKESRREKRKKKRRSKMRMGYYKWDVVNYMGRDW